MWALLCAGDAGVDGSAAAEGWGEVVGEGDTEARGTVALLAKSFLVLSLPVFEMGHSSHCISEAEAQVSERDICSLGKDQGQNRTGGDCPSFHSWQGRWLNLYLEVRDSGKKKNLESCSEVNLFK